MLVHFSRRPPGCPGPRVGLSPPYHPGFVRQRVFASLNPEDRLVENHLQAAVDVFGPAIVAGHGEHRIGEPPEAGLETRPRRTIEVVVVASVPPRQEFPDPRQPAGQFRVGTGQAGPKVLLRLCRHAPTVMGQSAQQVAPPLHRSALHREIDGRGGSPKSGVSVDRLRDGDRIVRIPERGCLEPLEEANDLCLRPAPPR